MWRLLSCFPKYEINEFGVIRNAETHYVTTQRMNQHGYLYVQLTDGKTNYTRLVHRLVAETFLPNPENLPIVNHIDECCVHNSADNLEWISYKGNSNHGTRNERIIRNRKDAVIAIDVSGTIVKRFSSKHEAGRELNVSEAAIRKAIMNKTKCRGLFWALESNNGFSENEDENYEYLEREKYCTKEYHANNTKGRIPLKAVNEDGSVVFRFKSKREAGQKLRVSQGTISNALKNHCQIGSIYIEIDEYVNKE